MTTPEELNLLEMLAAGVLDGVVGDEREYHIYRSIYCGKLIRNGIPIIYRKEPPNRTVAGNEPDEYEEETFDTDDRKLEFLQRYDWLMNNETVRKYSAHFKRRRAGAVTKQN